MPQVAIGAGIGAIAGGVMGNMTEKKIGKQGGRAFDFTQQEIAKARQLSNQLFNQSRAELQNAIAANRAYTEAAMNANNAYTQQALNALAQNTNIAIGVRMVSMTDAIKVLQASAGAAEKDIKEWANKAFATLEPLIKQANGALDEMASMMGIENSKGEVVPYDLDKLRATPGYQFQLQEGLRMVERTAVGKRLSSQTIDRVKETEQSIAANTFNTRYAQLGILAQPGVGAAQQKAAIAANVGTALGQLKAGTGANIANVIAGMNPSDLYANFGGLSANMLGQAGANAVNILGQAGANEANAFGALASSYQNQAAINNALSQGLIDARWGKAGAQQAGANAQLAGLLGGAGIGALAGSAYAGLNRAPAATTADYFLPSVSGQLSQPIASIANPMYQK